MPIRFSGQADVTIDAKQRLAVPAKFRKGMTESELLAGWYCVPWSSDRSLRLYPAATFDRLASELDGPLMPAARADALKRQLFSQAEHAETDATFRIRLEQRHIDQLKLPNEVVVVGARDWLEIHDRATWSQLQAAMFEQLPEITAAWSQSASQAPASTPNPTAAG